MLISTKKLSIKILSNRNFVRITVSTKLKELPNNHINRGKDSKIDH